MGLIKKHKVLVTVLMAVVVVGMIFTGWLWVRRNRAEILRETLLDKLECTSDYAENSVILKGIDRKEADDLAKKYGAELRVSHDGSFCTLTFPDEFTINDFVENKDNLRYIEYVEVDYLVKLYDSPDDSLLDITMQSAVSAKKGDHYPYIEFDTVHTITRGKNTAVAIIDSGIDYDHSAFRSTKISPYSYNASTDEIVEYSKNTDGSYNWSVINDTDGHGTAVAGIITDIAPDTELYVIKVQPDDQGNTQHSHIQFALSYVTNNCCRDVSAVNMSWEALITLLILKRG